MGFFDSLSDIVAAATPWSTVEAEAPTKGGAGTEKTPANADKEEGDGEGEGKKDDKGDDEESEDKDEGESKDDDKDDGEDEEEEEEEMVDPKEKLEEECTESKQCSPAKHHYDECVERVTSADHSKAHDKKHPEEDCVEEFFHLAHCATQCAAPKLWSTLK